jgi:hypothetical protein
MTQRQGHSHNRCKFSSVLRIPRYTMASLRLCHDGARYLNRGKENWQEYNTNCQLKTWTLDISHIIDSRRKELQENILHQVAY